MSTVDLLDVTLRDGGNRVNFHFNDEMLQQTLCALDNSGIEYIEIGYRNGAIRPVENIGRAGLCAKEYLMLCQSLIKKAKIVVMAHPQNISKADINELKTCGVALLRICISKGEVEKAATAITLSKQENLDVSVNFIHASYYQDHELDDAVRYVSKLQPRMIYLADSNGSLHPEKIKLMYKKYTNYSSIPFGFHAHDNLGLAQANAIAAIDGGAKYIDASLAGMGKGIGNLRTEFFVAFLQALNIKKYNLETILPAANYIRKIFNTSEEHLELDEFTRGILDLSTADLKKLRARSS